MSLQQSDRAVVCVMAEFAAWAQSGSSRCLGHPNVFPIPASDFYINFARYRHASFATSII